MRVSSSNCRAEVEAALGRLRRPCDIERPHHSARRDARVGAGDARVSAPASLSSAGERERAPAVGHDLDRAGERPSLAAKSPGPAEFDPIGDPQDFRLRLAREKPLDRRQCRRAIGRVGNRRERAQPALDAGRSSGAMSCPPCDSGDDRHDSPAPVAAAALWRAKSIRLSHVGAAGQPSSIRTSSGPDPDGRQRLFHSGPAMARMISAADREPQRQDWPGRARRRRLVRIKPEKQPQRREHRATGTRRRDAQQEIERRRDRQAPPGRRGRRRRAAGRTSLRRSAAGRRTRARKGGRAAQAGSLPAEHRYGECSCPSPSAAQMPRIASRCAARRAR